jgi:hypothetical protein
VLKSCSIILAVVVVMSCFCCTNILAYVGCGILDCTYIRTSQRGVESIGLNFDEALIMEFEYNGTDAQQIVTTGTPLPAAKISIKVNENTGLIGLDTGENIKSLREQN